MKSDDIDVPQGESVYDYDAEWVETSGLGPCIGVAIVFNGRVSVTHQHSAHSNLEYFRFCEEVAQHIPVSARASISPIVAGGQICRDDPEDDPDEIMKAREHVESTLSALGFDTLQICWCPDDAQSQTIVINTEKKKAAVEIDFWDDRPQEEVKLRF